MNQEFKMTIQNRIFSLENAFINLYEIMSLYVIKGCPTIDEACAGQNLNFYINQLKKNGHDKTNREKKKGENKK